VGSGPAEMARHTLLMTGWLPGQSLQSTKLRKRLIEMVFSRYFLQGGILATNAFVEIGAIIEQVSAVPKRLKKRFSITVTVMET
jgi:hypothetical protein